MGVVKVQIAKVKLLVFYELSSRTELEVGIGGHGWFEEGGNASRGYCNG